MFALVDWNQSECTLQRPCKLANCQFETDPRYPNCLTVGDLGYPDKHNDTDMVQKRVYSEDEMEVEL
jgi:hypothetical protein